MAEQEKRKKAVKGLEWLLENMIDTLNDFMFSGYDGPAVLANKPIIEDAIALLKAQEPVEPTIGGDADGPCGNWWYQCGKCKEAIDYHDKYCRNCGQAVKWE